MKQLYFLFFFVFGVCAYSQNPDDIVYIPDANFKAILINATEFGVNQRASTEIPDIHGGVNSYDVIDVNGDGEIQYSEAQAIKYLQFYDEGISSLEGINSFNNLMVLAYEGNNIVSLELNNFADLFMLGIHWSPLNAISLVNCPNIRFLGLSNNQLTTLDLTNLTYLRELLCNFNQLTYLDISNLNELNYIECNNNNLSHLDITGSNNIEFLNCNYNQLTSLDVSHLDKLIELECGGNPIISLNIKNGIDEEYVYFYPNTTLRYICVDEFQLTSIEEKAQYLDYCTVSTYCSFTPGGKYFTIAGSNRYDFNMNGCDTNDVKVPNLKFNITDGTISGTIISDIDGDYSIPVLDGTHTITPILENPNYFTVSPASITVDFPATTSPFNQDFCITPNGIHHDLEITIAPITPVRPGFYATFKLIYKNKGTQVQSGSVQFNFDDALMDFVSSTPNTYNQTLNNIYMSYTNLLPTETREMTVVMNINSPMETPAVNGDDQLGFYAIISPFEQDENYDDNHSQIKVVVVNSFDPNDKTCLEGVTITPSMVGQYVHYVIRFENTGTFAAENIVVADFIDETKFDISSLITQHSSHNFFTRINGNKVEFIFEGINLPFDDANNDGYVAFKIKTKPTLVLGDTFTNSASIYFDYNFPIITDPASTTVAELNTNDFNFGNYFTLFPNPVKDILNFEVKNEIGVKSISIYNTLGQIVMAITNVDNLKHIDVSSLTSGSYFLKVYSNKGSSSSKFIKQ
jgi:hypothetical protein